MFFALHSLGTATNAEKLVASVTPGTSTAVGVGNGPYTTNSVVASAMGGILPYSYAWSSSAGDTLTISSSTSSTVTWSASGTAPSSKTATWACVITDGTGVSAATDNVSVNVSFNLSTIAASLSSTSATYSLNGDGTITTDAISVTASNGTPPYTYAWTKVSGETLVLSSSAGASTTFSYDGVAPSTVTSVYQCVVSDSINDTVNAGSVNISMTFNYGVPSISLSETSPYGTRANTGVATSSSVTATVTGGTPPYTYAWSRVSGDGVIIANSISSSITTFSRYGSPINTYNADWKLTVIDANNQIATSPTVSVEIEFA